MPPSSPPCAVLDREVGRGPILFLYHLNPAQRQWLWDVMVMNSDGPIHDARSRARAHLDWLDSTTGWRAAVRFFNEQDDAYTEFMDYLTKELGVEVFDNVQGELLKRA